MTDIERFWRKLAHDPALPGWIKAWREHRHYTQRALAADAGCAVTTINEIETGKRPPRVSTLKHIVHALDISPWMLRAEPSDPDVLASKVELAIMDLESAIDAYEASGRDAAAFAADRGGDEEDTDLDLDALDRIRQWAVDVFNATGWSPAGTYAEHAARLTGRQADLARAWADLQAVVNDITAEAQRDPRRGSHKEAMAIFGDPPTVC